MKDFSEEIIFKTSRSGGKGGQNVNKVETAVEALWNIQTSKYFIDDEKLMLKQKLSNQLNSDGLLSVKSTTDRTQLGNKQIAVQKMLKRVHEALLVRKKRIATHIPKAVKISIRKAKEHRSSLKQSRRKGGWE